jgi:hypothetical protein
MEEEVTGAEEAEGEDDEGEQEEAADLAASLGLVRGVSGLDRVCDSGRDFLRIVAHD